MKLISNWQAVLKHAWSPRLILILGLLNGLYALTDVLIMTMPVPPMWLAVVNAALAGVTFVSRFIPQEKVSGHDQ